MKLSACDIGNPIYRKSGPAPDGGLGTVKAKIFTSGPEEFEEVDIDYEWERTPDGIEVTATKPVVAGADDIDTDVLLAIEGQLNKQIRHITWTA